MAVETYDISYIRDTSGKTLFPVTHSDALVGSISKRLYNISDGIYNGDWNNVIYNGFYKDLAFKEITNADGYDVYSEHYTSIIVSIATYEPYEEYYLQNPMLTSCASISPDHEYYESIGQPDPDISGIVIQDHLPTNNFEPDYDSEDPSIVYKSVIDGIHIIYDSPVFGAPESPDKSDVDLMLPISKDGYEINKDESGNNHYCMFVNGVYIELLSFSFGTPPVKPTTTIVYPTVNFQEVISSDGSIVYTFIDGDYYLYYVNPTVEYNYGGISNRPPSDINNYMESCFIKVTNSSKIVIQETYYPSTNEGTPISISGSEIKANYYRVGEIITDTDGNITVSWGAWTKCVCPGGGSESSARSYPISILPSDWNNQYSVTKTIADMDEDANSMVFMYPAVGHENNYTAYAIRASGRSVGSITITCAKSIPTQAIDVIVTIVKIISITNQDIEAHNSDPNAHPNLIVNGSTGSSI